MIKRYRLNIDEKEVYAYAGQTILEVARENGIFIPTLCYDQRTEIYGSCGICVCEVEGNPKLVKACATEVVDGMIIRTNTERVYESRKTNLELLLSNHVGDCRPPCVLACPAGTDCQGYVGLIANGQFEEALRLIKENIPLPGSLGRVCPHPCEDKCRRRLVDGEENPISIRWLKRFVADYDMTEENPFIPSIMPETGRKVAIIGGGPMGLSAAYFLRQKGHSVTIYDAMPKLGGMLRYGIPEYRLPKEILDEEIHTIEEMGVNIVTNTQIGVDLTFESVRAQHDAVLIGIGAWLSTGTGCKGEDLPGVIGGIDFLRKVVKNQALNLGERVVIVGGGNTAMDACRTAVRLGAKEVYNVYRRTIGEMPADSVEIEEAKEEGVIFKNLRNPIEFVSGKDGRVKQVVLQVMELGEPDASGRRAPVPVAGKTEVLDIDTAILAIGQAVDARAFELEKTRKSAVAYDKETFMTSIPGVFAGGDCGNDKISIAVEAIADARKAAESIDAYLAGEELRYVKPYTVERHDVDEKTFEDRERMCRSAMEMLSPDERKGNFSEVVQGFSEEEAMADASRCLECGCHDYFECKLVDYAGQYDVKPDRFAGDINKIEYKDEHPFILRDPNKCILCGLCERVCEEVMGVGALGLVHRGFDTVVKPAMEKPLAESGCVCCGQCVNVCPTGALQERLTLAKSVPLETDTTETTCAYCSVGCSLDFETYGDLLIKANPSKDGYVNKGLSCGKGKWGFDCAMLEDRLYEPMIKTGDGFLETDYHNALMTTAKKLEGVAMRYGKDAVGVAISDRYTNEEAYVIKKMAGVLGARVFSFNNRKSGLLPVMGHDASPNTIDELLSTDLILVVGFNTRMNPVIGIKMRQARRNGARIILLNPETYYDREVEYAEKKIFTDNSLNYIKALAKALLDMGLGTELEGYEQFKESLSKVVVSPEIREVAQEYKDAKKAMIVYQQNLITTEAATLVADIALLSGHIGAPRDGILQVKAKNNSQGLIDLGIKDGEERLEGLKALLIFGEDPAADLSNLEFLMVSDVYMTETASKADVIIPAMGFASVDGTFTNTERRLMPVQASVDEDVELSNWEIAAEIAHIFEQDFGYEDAEDISAEMDDNLAKYKYAEIGQVLGGVLKPFNPKLVSVKTGVFVDKKRCTDDLMNIITSRLPMPANSRSIPARSNK